MHPRIRPRNSLDAHDLRFAALIAASAFVALGAAAHNDVFDDLNRRVRRALRPHHSSRIHRIATALSALAAPQVHPFTSAIASALISRRTGRRTIAPLVASLSMFAVNRATRLVVKQPRPPLSSPRKGLDRLGFPSGHTMAATASAFAMALELHDDLTPRQQNAALIGAASYASLIAWTRLELDEHWLDDVAGGFAAGLTIALLLRSRRQQNY